MGAFIHFGPATYIASDFMSVPAADLFNPSQLNAEQWVKTAKSFGAKHIVLTAKHHNGYCLWPTKTTDYSVEQSPWKDGKGDVVAEFVDACRKYDIKIGLYISGGDKHIGVTSTPDPQGERKLVGDIHQYFPVFLEQLRELLTNYGKISYVWFDGAYDPFGWDVMDPKTMKPLGTAYGDAIRTMVGHLQPDAVVMGGTKPDVRWSGSEQGWAAYPLWNTLEPGEGFSHWVGPQTAGYIPAEANIHTREKWFWTPNSDNTLRDMDYLKKVYLETIGRGANILINMTPDTTGLIPPKEVERLDKLGSAIDKLFSAPIGTAEVADKQPVDGIYIDLPKKKSMNLLVIEEDLKSGQYIKEYKVEAFIKGKWVSIAKGTSIGRKRIQTFERIKTTKLRLSYTSVAHDEGSIRSFTVYDADF
jgi:alpha-L-fucosidase